jgi:uncharacterized protein (DUF1697 family)
VPGFVALLRGVNVGKAKRVPMAELRALLAGLGYERAATLLNSGNAVFHGARGTAAGHATKIAAALQAHFGFEVPVVVKGADELDAIIAANTLVDATTDPARLLVVFAQGREQLASVAAVAPLVSAPERLLVGADAAYLYCANGILESKAGAALLGKLGKQSTTRNWSTTVKLQALLASV